MSSMDDANRRFREEIYKETKKMKLTALQNADNYINWLNSLTRSTHTSLPSRNEEKLIAKLRQVSLDIKFTKLEVSLNEEGSAVIVWLRCSGKHQLDWGKIRATGKEIIAHAAVLMKIDKNNSKKFSEIDFIFDEALFFRKIGVDLGDLKNL